MHTAGKAWFHSRVRQVRLKRVQPTVQLLDQLGCRSTANDAGTASTRTSTRTRTRTEDVKQMAPTGSSTHDVSKLKSELPPGDEEHQAVEVS